MHYRYSLIMGCSSLPVFSDYALPVLSDYGMLFITGTSRNSKLIKSHPDSPPSRCLEPMKFHCLPHPLLPTTLYTLAPLPSIIIVAESKRKFVQERRCGTPRQRRNQINPHARKVPEYNGRPQRPCGIQARTSEGPTRKNSHLDSGSDAKV
jgi:hypothetical protein